MKKNNEVMDEEASLIFVFKENWQAFWDQREAREKRMLILASVVVIVALLYSALINPALSGRAKLQTAIPELRQQVAQMEMLSKQSAEMSVAIAENIAPISRESIEASLTRRSVKTQSLSVSDDVVRVQIASMAYASLMEWLIEMQKTARLSVEDARVVALPENGMVSVAVTLKQQRNAS